jgi:hypothetical protein
MYKSPDSTGKKVFGLHHCGREGMLRCKRKNKDWIAIGRCVLMRNENIESCEGCPYQDKDFGFKYEPGNGNKTEEGKLNSVPRN